MSLGRMGGVHTVKETAPVSTDTTCDNDGAPSRAVVGRDGRYCSTGCLHAAECRGDGSCCSDGTENPAAAVTPGKG